MRLAREVDQRRSDPANPITVKTAVHEDQVQYLYEHQSEFPGVQIQQTYLRHYRYQSLAAQILGYVGEISAEELKRKAREGYRLGDKIGKTGVEATFDAYLRGRPGWRRSRSTRSGGRRARSRSSREQRPGNAVRLTIDIDLQRAAERALQRGHPARPRPGRVGRERRCDRRARPERRRRAGDGLVLQPTSRPSTSAGSTRRRSSRWSTSARPRAANHPGLNRAIAGLYPPGSTFKPVVALAAMQEHLLAPYDSIWCTPVGDVRPRQAGVPELEPVREPADVAADGARRVVRHVLLRGRQPLLQRAASRGRERLQEWAHRFGFGEQAGLDIGGEATGLVPTPAWRKKTFKSSWDRAWNPGDSIQLAIGQKDLTVTPLQLARFYAMLANGGKLVTPYVVAVGRAARRERTAERDADAVHVRPAAARRRRSGRARARPRRPVRGDAQRQRHGVRRVRELPGARSPGRRARPRRSSRCPGYPARPPGGPVVVVRLGPVRRLRVQRAQADRRLRADRERRPRLDRGGADGAQASSSTGSACPRPTRRPW